MSTNATTNTVMYIKIDSREHELIRTCKYYLELNPSYKNISIVVEQLSLGDIIITDGKTEKLIIERKSIRDLSASIKDGRYEEQSYRLNGISHPNHNIIYLIEGDMNRPNVFKDSINKMMMYSAMCSLLYFKGFSVIRSLHIDESALILCNMAYKISKGEAENRQAYYKIPQIVPVIQSVDNKIVVNDVTSENVDDTESKEVGDEYEVIDHGSLEKDYCSVVKKVKKDNITPNNIGEIILCQIPGISSITACAIMLHFKTLPNLIFEIAKDDMCLAEVNCTNSKNQVRKLNKTVIANIIKFLK